MTQIVPTYELFPPDAYVDVGGGNYTLTVGVYANDLTRADGSPAQPSDVLSVQKNGSWRTQPAGTAGNFEVCRKTSAGAVFRPVGSDGKTFLVGVAADAPNS